VIYAGLPNESRECFNRMNKCKQFNLLQDRLLVECFITVLPGTKPEKTLQGRPLQLIFIHFSGLMTLTPAGIYNL
jgi:hypothetical protein